MNMERDLLFSIQTRHSDRERPATKCSQYGDEFKVVRTDLKRIAENLMGLEEITASLEVDIVEYEDNEWLDDRSNQKWILTTSNSSYTSKN